MLQSLLLSWLKIPLILKITTNSLCFDRFLLVISFFFLPFFFSFFFLILISNSSKPLIFTFHLLYPQALYPALKTHADRIF